MEKMQQKPEQNYIMILNVFYNNCPNENNSVEYGYFN